MTLGVRTIVIDGENRVLLVRHTYTPGWHFPGGGVDVGETVADAARRELREEANTTAIGPLLLHGVFLNTQGARRDHVACYVVPRFEVGPAPRPSLEIAEVVWFSLQALPPDLSPATARRLREITAEAPPDALW
ncbi:NUDIX domain-containing protein [Azorhizobium sp. AG788]|uniref:NUDIX domain-containing protein n=1 Tax=Azorhizobium sp. AG788 TaxID=2183897 RepID=UPI003139BE09